MTMVWMDVWDSCGLTSDVGVPLAHLIIPPASDTWSIIFSSCPSVCPSALLTNHWPTDQMTDHPFIYPERFLGIFCGIKVRKGHFLPLCLSETGQILVFKSFYGEAWKKQLEIWHLYVCWPSSELIVFWSRSVHFSNLVVVLLNKTGINLNLGFPGIFQKTQKTNGPKLGMLTYLTTFTIDHMLVSATSFSAIWI